MLKHFNLAIFEGVKLREVNLSPVQMSDFQVKSTFGDATVTLPKNMRRPLHWANWKLPFSGENGFNTEWRKWQTNPEGYDPPKEPKK